MRPSVSRTAAPSAAPVRPAPSGPASRSWRLRGRAQPRRTSSPPASAYHRRAVARRRRGRARATRRRIVSTVVIRTRPRARPSRPRRAGAAPRPRPPRPAAAPGRAAGRAGRRRCRRPPPPARRAAPRPGPRRSRAPSGNRPSSSCRSSTGSRAATRSRPSSSRATSGTSSASYSSVISPTISSRMSSIVTTPAVPPYSSTTIAMWLRVRCISLSSSSMRLLSGTYTAGRMTAVSTAAAVVRSGLCFALGPHQVLEVGDADDVVDVLPQHRQPRVAAAQGQPQHLVDGGVALHPHHVRAGHHHLADERVAQLEHRVDHLALGLVDDAAGAGHVDQLAQLHLGGERALAEALAGRHRVADQDQQLGQRAEQRRERPDRRGDRRRPARRGAGGRACAGRRRSGRS